VLAVVTLEGVRVLAAEEEEGSETVGEGEAHTEEVEEEPNPILPVGKEIAWGLGSFLVLVVLMRFVAYPRLKQGMDARAAAIRSNLDAADRAKAEADKVMSDYQASLAQAKVQANGIMEEARREVEAVRAERIGALGAELAQMRAQAASEISAAKQAAVASMRAAVADLAVGAAEKVVGKGVDRGSAESAVAEFLTGAAR